MAAFSEKRFSWREKLNNHAVCQRLREKNKVFNTKKRSVEAKSLLCVDGSDLFIWDDFENAILHCNLRALDSDSSSDDGVQALDLNSDGIHKQKAGGYQRLLLTDHAHMTVEDVSANRSGSHLLIWGTQGILVIELPRKWGPGGMFEGSKETVSCRTIRVAERTFCASSSLRINQVSWHPGSKTDSHVAVLASNNTFSVYDIDDPNDPFSIVNLIPGSPSLALSPSKSFVSSAIGETAVAFDFGSPIELKQKQRLLQASNTTTAITVLPVYLVRGNGDVLLVYSHLSNVQQLRLPVQGPLVMFPPADDNYGVDACSILCLHMHTPTPVIVISTCEGRLHHCVQLPADPEEEETTLRDTSFSHSSSPSSNPLYQAIPEPTLFVIQTAELELCLSVPSLNEQTPFEDELICPIKLKKDDVSADRYHCSHAAGVHSVALPWLHILQQFFLEDGADFSISEDKECVVEHLFCTKPLMSCPSAPVLGMDVVNDVMLGPTLVILASDYQFTALPIGYQYKASCSSSLENNDLDAKASASRESTRQPFSQHIAQILQRKASNPLLKSGSDAELDQHKCFQLLSRATQVLREEYIQRQDRARQEIDMRVAMLSELKEFQLHDLKKLLNTKLILMETARTVAEKLNAYSENHESLVKRLEKVLRQLQNHVPYLSNAERAMKKELENIKANMQTYQQNIEQVRVKMEYQERQIDKSDNCESPVLQKKQLTHIYDILKEEGLGIEELKKDLSQLSLEMS